jgi:hypothetical protein
VGNGNVTTGNATIRYAWSLPLAEVRALGLVLGWSGVEVLEAAPRLWLRASALSDEQWDACLRLPGADRFTLLSDGQLIRVGNTVPHGRLPQGTWTPIRNALRLELPRADDGPTRRPTPTNLRLVRSTEPAEPNWLLVKLADWVAYAATAPQVRLARLSFVAAERVAVAVRGEPLPPLAGRRFVERSGIVVPAGWTWAPALPAEIVREALKLAPGDCAWFGTDGTWRVISSGDWVQASRSAARLTAAEVQG